MNFVFPKNASEQLKRQAKRTLDKFKAGIINGRKSKKEGYLTIAINRCERAVILGHTVYVFSKHSDYEKFIDQGR